jgi:hypothetical protein
MRKLLVVVALVLVGACSDDDEAQFDGDPSLPDPGGAPAPVDVAGALEAGDGTLVRVAGHLIALPDGTAELCGGPIQESAPPQCGEPALPVDGLDDPASVPGAAEVGGWVEGDVVLTGVVDGGRLDVS